MCISDVYKSLVAHRLQVPEATEDAPKEEAAATEAAPAGEESAPVADAVPTEASKE